MDKCVVHTTRGLTTRVIDACNQSFVGINELPVFEKPGLVNTNRLRKLGELVVEVLRRRSVPYALTFDDDIDVRARVHWCC